jgi:pimeloyl-ACP methyl ester carboxylesterase
MNTRKINILDFGSGIPVVLLHSSMSSKIQWYRLMQAMAKDHHMIAPDLYGYGDSVFPTNSNGFSLIDEVTIIESYVVDMIPEDMPFHLVGHSYGAAVALRFCYKYKETKRIRSLSIYEPVAFHLLPEDDEALIDVHRVYTTVKEKMLQGNDEDAAAFFVDFWSGGGTYASFPVSVKEVMMQGIKKLPLDFKALFDEPLGLYDYHEIQTPVCLMAGKKSPIGARRITELLAPQLRDCETYWLDADHMAPLYQANEVNTIMETFIRRH